MQCGVCGQNALCNVGTGSLRAKCFMTDDFEIESDDMKSESDPIQRN